MSKDIVNGKYIIGGDTKVGDPRRKHEDRIFKGVMSTDGGSNLIIGIVADGVGSADSGERGAQLAIDTVISEIQRAQDENIPDLIERAIRSANLAVNEDNQANEGDGLTTLTVAIVHNGRCFVGNVGDSRAYWVQGGDKGKMLQITRDHSYYNMYGGDPNAEDAEVLVNAIGRKDDIYVDLGFYLGGEQEDPEKALRLGVNGLPLKPGDSIVLCSDGLIKTDPMGERYAKDSEIVNAIRTEYEANAAAVKMVSAALGRRPDDNVSAVTIQYLTPDLIAMMKSRTGAAKTRQLLFRVGSVVFAVIALVAIVVLGFRAARPPEIITQYITNTPMPTMTPTQPIDPGKARVDYASPLSSVSLNQEIDPGTGITSVQDGVRIVVGEQSVYGNLVGVMYWFGDSLGVVDFDFSHMKPILSSGALYIQPGNNKALVGFSQWNDIRASVEGSRMIVEIIGNDIWIYCFEGDCRLDPGAGGDVFKIQPGYKRLYSPLLSQVGSPIEMTYDEMWLWNVKCNYCMSDWVGLPTPTPTKSTNNQSPNSNNSNDDNNSSQTGGGNQQTVAPPPTDPPPTDPPPTDPPPTDPPPTDPPPTDPPPTDPPPTDPPPTDPPPTDPPPTDPPPTDPPPGNSGNPPGQNP